MRLELSLALVFCAAAGAAGNAVPTLEESLGMKSVSGAQISPNGRYVAYTVQQANWDENDFYTQIWIAVPATGERYQLTSGKKSSSGAQWAPDSRRLAFTSDRDGKRQIYLISPAGGEAAVLTAEENGVGAIAWSPDGSAIAFTSSGPDAKARKDRKEKYGDFEIVGGDYTMNHLWLLKVPAELPSDLKKLPKPEALTTGDAFSVGAFSWSPDGKRIAFSASRDPDLGSGDTETLYLLDLADLHVKKLLASGGPSGNPKWSPDGKEIAYTTSNGQPFFFFANRYLAVIPAEGGAPRLLTREFDEDANLLDWGGDGIYFAAIQKTASHLFRIDAATGAIHRISGPDAFNANGASFTRDHGTLAATGAAPNRFPEVFVSSASDFAPKYLTDVASQYKDFRLATREVVQWKSRDGAAIEGILIKPAGYDASRKYPLLVVIHGGPTGVDSPVMAADRYYPVERFAAKGALVLKPNYRGSAGYGEKFRALNVRNLGLGDYDDVIAGVDSLIARGIVDKDRVGAMGWSQGGYISAFITCYSDRFKAVSVGAGISDWMTYYVNTDIHPFTRQYLKATPWDDPEIYRKTSPITYVSRAQTPTLIQHGDQDKRVPPPNAFELFQALQDRKVPVKLILYKGFGHPINKPKQQLAVMEHNYQWFSKYIWGEEQDRPPGLSTSHLGPASQRRRVGLFCKSMLPTPMRYSLTAVLFWIVWSPAARAQQPSLLVDPLIGTAGDGQTYPAAGVPFGMTQWTPETRAGEVKCIAPYYAKDTRIQGFRGTHFLSGSCVQDYGSMTVMASTGELKTAGEARASAYSRDTERARPQSYEVTLADYGIRASVTGTTRAGLLRFRFPKSSQAWILVESNARPGEGEIRVDAAAGEVAGTNPVHRLYAGAGKPAGFSGYFVARFSRPFRRYGTWSGAERHESATRQAGANGVPGAYLGFETAEGETISVKVGTSFVSVEEARRNLDAEIQGWDFDKVAAAAQAAWDRALGQIAVRGDSETRRRVFYTALYHSMLAPRTYSDAGGTYPRFAGGGSVETARGFTYYCDFSLWDTFRSLHPLMTIIDPGRTADMMQSLVAKGQQGGWMPIFPAWNSYTQEMIGDHAAAVIADAYIKGIRGFDIQEAYRLLRQNATQSPASQADYLDGRGRRALPDYLKYGFVPLDNPVTEAFHKGEQVSRTLEYAYDDFVMGELARALGKSEDADLFRGRAMNYRNIIDPATGFARGRHADGSWVSPFDPAKPASYITEGLPFQYTFFVPQDMRGLIALVGGKEAFLAKLDALFAGHYYEHGNEPSHHIAYLYDFAGAPWKTQQHVREVMRTQYTDGASGLAGNEDGGQMSAWYVLSAIGMYPVTPGVPVYELGSPEFDQASIRLAGGKQFTIRAPGASRGLFYIQSATLNGKPLNRPWIEHREIVSGGELVFTMGATPNLKWGAAPEDAPPSLTRATGTR